MDTQSTRQQKVAGQIRRDIAEIFQTDFRGLFSGVLITVTTVRISPDFGYAKIYVSLFPFSQGEQTLETLRRETWAIRKALGSRIRHQLRIVPEIEFFLDDSLEYIENIERAIKG